MTAQRIQKSSLETDVVIVGAGSAGSYLAREIASKGHRVRVIEKEKQGVLGAHIGIFHMDEIRFAQFDIPLPEGNERIGYYPTGLAWPPDGKTVKEVRYAFYVMELPLFIVRMQQYAQEAGAKIHFETEFTEVILENGKIAGIRIRKAEDDIEVRAKIVIDATGVESVVRTSLPDRIGLETAPIRPEEFLYVILQYWDDIEGDLPRGLNFYPFHKAFINPSYGDGAIVGIGQPGSLDLAKQVQEEFIRERFADVKYTLKRKTWGRTPFRRPPYSLVSDGFMVVGDAAYLTKPFSGEGVTSGFTACKIAAAVADAGLRQGDVSRASLWPLNVRYFRDQGAKFAGLFAQLPAAAELSRKDVNWLFENDLIFSGPDFEAMNRDFEVKNSLGKTIVMAWRLLAGRITGGLTKEGFSSLMAAMSAAGKIRKHYEGFPEHPDQFEGWVSQAKHLWKET